jgi:hypothetical protein
LGVDQRRPTGMPMSIWRRAFQSPLSIGALSLFVVMLFSLWANQDCLGIGIDGASWQTYIDYQVHDRAPFSQLGVDAHQGDFDAYYPLDNDFTVPGALYRLLGKSAPPGPLPTYAIYAVVLAAVMFLLAQCFEIEAATAAFASFIVMFFFPPLIVHHFAPTFSLLHRNPHWMQLIIFSSLIIAAFWALDGKWTPGRVLLMCVPTACATIEVLSVGAMIIFTPAVVLYGGASALFAKNRQAVVQKIVAAGLAMLTIALSGQAVYLYGLERYSAYHYFQNEFDWDEPISVNMSIVFYYPFGTILIIGGILGAAATALGKPSKLRQIAFVHLACSALFFAAAVTFFIATLHSGYRTSPPFYFETTYMPFAAMFCAVLVGKIAALTPLRRADAAFGGTAQWGRPMPALLLFSIAVMAGYNGLQVARATPDLCAPHQIYQHEKATKITDVLQREAAIGPGTPFRGNVMTIDRPDSDAAFASGDMRDEPRLDQLGNELRYIGLWRFGIPTMYQDYTFITAPYYLLLTEFVARPQDVQTRSGLVLTQIDAGMLRLWGVRFVITDDPGKFGRELASLPLVELRPVRLIELDQPNLGDYSPTSVKRVPDFHSGLELLHDPAFDGARTVLTDETLDTDGLVAATGVRLTYETYGFHIQAESTGRSILVLPPQFSRCWSAEGTGTPRLFRANLMQLGLEFSGKLDARLIFRYGPLLASTCRLIDIADVDRLKIAQGRVLPRGAPFVPNSS